MKKLEIVVKPEKLEDLKMILDECNASGLMITLSLIHILYNKKGAVNPYLNKSLKTEGNHISVPSENLSKEENGMSRIGRDVYKRQTPRG